MDPKKYKPLPHSEPEIKVLNIEDGDVLTEYSNVTEAKQPSLFAFAYSDGSDSDAEGCEFGGDMSDSRLKENIIKLKKPLEKIAALNGYEYFWKDRSKDPRKQYGVIAQEVQNVFPELVHTDEKTDILSVNYTGLIAPMIEAVKELQKEVATLKLENKAIKEALEVHEHIASKTSIEKDLLKKPSA